MDIVFFGVVLFIPCRGRFMQPLAVAGLGLRYLSTNSSLIFGHPLRYPLRMALMSLDIFGLHSAWWANFTCCDMLYGRRSRLLHRRRCG